MKRRADPAALRLLTRLYRRLLAAYPRSFRAAYGAQMVQVFRDEARESLRERKALALLPFLASSLSDLALNSAAERGQEILSMSPAMLFKLGALSLVSLACGAAIAWLDFNADEVQPAVLLLLVSGFGLGAFDPSRAWLWAALLGSCIPALHFLAPRLELVPRYPMPVTPWYAIFLPLIPAAIGAAVGAAVRLALSKIHAPSG